MPRSLGPNWSTRSCRVSATDRSMFLDGGPTLDDIQRSDALDKVQEQVEGRRDELAEDLGFDDAEDLVETLDELNEDDEERRERLEREREAEESEIQAERQAAWLSKWIGSAVAEPVSVRAVVALPGWVVKRTSAEGIPVVNPKQFGSLCQHLQPRELSEEIEYRIKQYSQCIMNNTKNYREWLQEDYERRLRLRISQLFAARM